MEKHEKQEAPDPHASKIDPNDPRLRLKKPLGRSLKKGPVILILSLILGVVLIAVSVALWPLDKRGGQEEEETSPPPQSYTIPNVIREGPDNDDPVSVLADDITAPLPDSIPRLGQPLPGDLGEAMVNNNRGNYYTSRQQDPEQQAYAAALVSAPFFQGSETGQMKTSGLTSNGMLAAYTEKPADAPGLIRSAEAGLLGQQDQNKQQRKNEFLSGKGRGKSAYLSGGMLQPKTPYEVKAGTIIPVTLITGINSDLPGTIIGQVREHVYDTVTGDYLLIPQGSRLLASYDSMVSYGQKRVLVCWNRLIRPDGSSIDLECMSGVDLEGYGGFKDKVDNHFDRLVGGALLSSLLSVGATTSQGTWDNEDGMSTAQMFASNVGSEISSTGQQITRKNLEIQPTLKIRPGYSVNVLVNKDMVITPFYLN